MSVMQSIGGRPSVLDADTRIMIHALRSYGMTFRRIAQFLKLDHVTVWRSYQLSTASGIERLPPD